MNQEISSTEQKQSKGYSAWQLAFFVLLTMVVTALVTAFIAYRTVFQTEFTPVRLTSVEQQHLEQKLEKFSSVKLSEDTPAGKSDSTKDVIPEPYSEEGASREINLTEKELNALLANNTDLARRAAIDLSDNLASAKLLLPLDPEFPFLGGKTLKLNAGIELAYANNKPIIVLRGVSLWGVPMPNAWLGGLKNVDLISEFGDQGGFWQSFADGIESVKVEQGKLHIVLKE